MLFRSVPSHAGESLAEGVGFALAGWFQVVAAWLFLSRRFRSFLVPIAVANVVFIGVWAWSRTAGIPFGAHAGHAESAGFVDLTTVHSRPLFSCGARSSCVDRAWDASGVAARATSPRSRCSRSSD